MATLVLLKGPDAGRQFLLHPTGSIIGRQADSTVCLESQAVSRHHARVLCDNGSYFVEDLSSSNGTYLNGKRVLQRVPMTTEDTLQVGPYFFSLRLEPAPGAVDDDWAIRHQVSADPSHYTLHGQDSRQKLRVVLEIGQYLARTLDPNLLLGKLLDHLMALFQQADRGIVLLCEGDEFVMRAQRCRGSEGAGAAPYSRTVVRRALQEGVGLLSEDLRIDQRFQSGSSVTSNLRSLLCVPLICPDGRRLGVLQLDCFHRDKAFQTEDLQLVTAVGLQAAVVLDNASLHAELIREERLRQELALAREIQQGFLPTNFPSPEEQGFELFARLEPAREVSGDLYDFFTLKDRGLAFFIGDVAGKGIPAALFLPAVRTLSRYLAKSSAGPAETLLRLHDALAADNFSGMFVTLLHGIYTPATGEIVLASGGHPPPLLRRADGQVEEVAVPSGGLLGYQDTAVHLTDSRLTLNPGDTLVLYTDGFIEARSPDDHELFGLERLRAALGGAGTYLSLEDCAERAKAAVHEFTGKPELQDDLTLLLLRRVSGGSESSKPMSTGAGGGKC
jgi:serine phosphatase RsbU (regulator of sigma subunit)